MAKSKGGAADWGLTDYEDAVDFDYDAKAPENCLYTPSPYLNWIFANKANGIPKGTDVLFSSEQKAGKTLLIQSIIGQMHQDDPEGIAIVFNTELRGKYQKGLFKNIDYKRLVIYDTNLPEDIFDRFNNDIYPKIQDGMPLRIVAIDSITNIAGRRGKDAESINDSNPGDEAFTKQTGLKRLIPSCKKHDITVFGTEQMRANLDMKAGPRAPATKSAANWFTKHAFEYFISIKRENAPDMKESLTGEKFESETIRDVKGNHDVTGHKIGFTMTASSIGVPNRSGVLTLDYKEGIINVHEEVFELGKNTGVIQYAQPMYVYKEEKWKGKEACILAIKENPELQKAIIADVIATDAGR